MMIRQRLFSALWACGFLLGLVAYAECQSIRVVRFAESEPFQMGSVTSRRILHSGNGAVNTTLNLSVSKPGAEFAQHAHDESSDAILVLEGEVNLRQGPNLRLFRAGECAFVPAGEVHGTVTAGSGEAVMISFQNPPDLVLYTGARDSSREGAAAPQGKITPDAVKFVNFRQVNGQFLGKREGAEKVAAFHYRLKRGEELRTRVADGGEAFFFVWKGALKANDGANAYAAGERDTVFVQGRAGLVITGDHDAVTEVIHVQAPPL